MIDQTRIPGTPPADHGRDEWSMRVMEYAIALVALAAALLLSIR